MAMYTVSPQLTPPHFCLSFA